MLTRELLYEHWKVNWLIIPKLEIFYHESLSSSFSILPVSDRQDNKI